MKEEKPQNAYEGEEIWAISDLDTGSFFLIITFTIYLDFFVDVKGMKTTTTEKKQGDMVISLICSLSHHVAS